jgi:polysaccharide deacetylase family sporulation protein PdaB
VRIITISYRRARRALLGILAAGALAGAVAALYPVAASPAAAPAADRFSLRGVVTSQKALALTFDISWGTVMPPKVLAILVRDHVPATFFLSGPWARDHPDFVRQLVRDGMEVESHGWAHVNYSGLSYAGVLENIEKTNQVLRELTGQAVSFVRPPNGDFNATAIRAAHALGYTVVTWGTDSLDWMNPGVSVIISRVVRRAHPGDIVLLHASDTCKQTDVALPVIIRDLRGEGYQLVTLRQLLTMGTPDYRG